MKVSVSLDGRALAFDPVDANDILENQEDAAFPGRATQNKHTGRLIAVIRELVRVVWDPDFEQRRAQFPSATFLRKNGCMGNHYTHLSCEERAMIKAKLALARNCT